MYVCAYNLLFYNNVDYIHTYIMYITCVVTKSLSAPPHEFHMFLTSQKFVLTIFQLSCVTRTSSKVVQMACSSSRSKENNIVQIYSQFSIYYTKVLLFKFYYT